MGGRAVTTLAVGLAVLVVLGACDRGSDRAGATGSRSITVVIAEYSKEHTKPFWILSENLV